MGGHVRPGAVDGRHVVADPVLRRGSTGDAVRKLQRALESVGNSPGSVDGIFGPKTEAAVRAFQTRRGLNLIDGLVGPETWGALPTSVVRVHLKILQNPDISTDVLVANMRTVYETARVGVEVASTETLSLPTLLDVRVGSCTSGQAMTSDQTALFGNRNNVQANEIAVYFVRTTIPPLNGCAAHPTGLSAAVVVQTATEWTFAHEVGHLLDLNHVDDNDRLMTGNGTINITNPPPDLDESEASTMDASPETIDL